MKISKSILSPGRARDGPISLSTSLSRRLRTNGSLKGAQSPMFPTAGGAKRRGCAFENPEPSSPKVTCIGQVRVKTKKQGKKIRTLSKRRGGSDLGSRRGEKSKAREHNFQLNSSINQQQQQQECLQQHRNQKWVHLPLTICEALRAFGAEFSCLFPCRPSCFSDRGKEEKERGSSEERSGGRGSCGAVFARWLVALNEGEGGRGREVELVVGGAEEEERREMISLRRHVDVLEEEMGMEDGKCEVKEGGGGGVEEEEGGRVSICIPPKNALLLMRCRSDPVRMSALANRFWESPVPKCEEEEEDDEEREEEEEGEGMGLQEVEEGGLKGNLSRLMDDKDVEEAEKLVSGEEVEEAEKLVSTEANEEQQESPVEEGNVVMELEEAEGEENPEEEKLEIDNDELPEDDEVKENHEPEVQEASQEVAAEEIELDNSSSEVAVDPEISENENADALLIQEREEEEEELEEIRDSHHSEVYVHSDLADEKENAEVEALAEETLQEAEEKSTEEKENQETPLKEEEEEESVTQERSETEQTQKEEEDITESEEREDKEEESPPNVERESNSTSVLPDCLLLMRCEPKLSMEVSKETWVCTTDFIRCLPERQPKAKDGRDEPKKRISIDSNPALPPHPAHYQPPRSSCSLPAVAGVSMATMIERKLVNAVAYEPLVLTRCKSEPMRTAAAKLAPETCFWKNRKLEPHRRATVGVGAAGVGF